VQAGPVTLEIQRSLETRRRESGLLGTRWRLNWESRLLHAGPLVLIEEAGVTVQFDSDGSGTGYKTASGDRVVFEKDGRATRTNPDGTKETFNAQGRLVVRDYRNGNRVVLHYGPEGRLAKIEGPRGSYFRFKTDNKDRVTLIESSTTATIRYAYSDNELSEARLPPRPPTRYSYYTGGELARIEDPQSGVVQFAYDYKGRVVSRSWADGSKERYEYDDAGSRLRYTDVLGAVTTTQWSQDKRRGGDDPWPQECARV
jgi:YD repeat-containing protein